MVLKTLVGFMVIIICAHGRINFKVGVMAPYNHLSQRSSFNVWKKLIPRMSLRISNLGDVGLVNIKINKNETNKDIFDWIQNFVPILSTTTEKPIKPEFCEICECGKPKSPVRIVGGHETAPNQYPWMVYFTYNARFYCAGVIINDRYIGTAAHCVDGFSKERIRIVAGSHNRNETSHPNVKVYRVSRIIIHSKYAKSYHNNDIALLKVHGIFDFNEKNQILRPLCLADRAITYSGLNGIVTGWGATSETGPVSNSLQQVLAPIITNAECRTKYPPRSITDNMLCAGFEIGGQDSCQGDSGGPLQVLIKNRFQWAGIVSWGEGCAEPDHPGVYTRVNRYRTWILNRTMDACYCDPSPFSS